MDNYHDFKCAHEVEIKDWQLYWSPNFVSIAMGTMVPTNVDVAFSSNVTSGNRNASSNGATESGGTIKCDGFGLSINA